MACSHSHRVPFLSWQYIESPPLGGGPKAARSGVCPPGAVTSMHERCAVTTLVGVPNSGPGVRGQRRGGCQVGPAGLWVVSTLTPAPGRSSWRYLSRGSESSIPQEQLAAVYQLLRTKKNWLAAPAAVRRAARGLSHVRATVFENELGRTPRPGRTAPPGQAVPVRASGRWGGAAVARDDGQPGHCGGWRPRGLVPLPAVRVSCRGLGSAL